MNKTDTFTDDFLTLRNVSGIKHFLKQNSEDFFRVSALQWSAFVIVSLYFFLLSLMALQFCAHKVGQRQ